MDPTKRALVQQKLRQLMREDREQERLALALEAAREAPWFLLTASNAALSLEDYPLAERLARECGSHFPEASEPLIALGRALTRQQRFADAVVVAEEAYERAPERWWRVGVALALALQAAGELPRARTLILELAGRPFSDVPADDRAYFLRDAGHLLGDLKEWFALDAFARRALDVDPGLAFAHVALGTALRERGEAEAATAACLEALAIDPGSDEAIDAYFETLTRFGRVAEAHAYIEGSLRTVAASRTTFRRAIEHATSFGCVDDWGALIARYAERARPDARTCSRLACMWTRFARYDEAVRWATRACELAPKDATHWLERATALGHAGEAAAVAECLREVERIHPESRIAHADWLIQVHVANRDYEHARALLVPYLERAPHDYFRWYLSYAVDRALGRGVNGDAVRALEEGSTREFGCHEYLISIHWAERDVGALLRLRDGLRASHPSSGSIGLVDGIVTVLQGGAVELASLRELENIATNDCAYLGLLGVVALQTGDAATAQKLYRRESIGPRTGALCANRLCLGSERFLEAFEASVAAGRVVP